MKRILNILVVTVFAAALMQLYYDHMVLKYNYEALVWQVKCENDQFKVLAVANLARTRQEALEITGMEAQLRASAAGKGSIN